MLTLKFVLEFSQEFFKARMLKRGLHMDNELLYCGIENWSLCSYSSLRLSIFIQFSLFL